MLHMDCGLGHKHQQGACDFVRCMYTEELVLESLCGLAELPIVGEVIEFKTHQLVNVTFNHIVLTLRHAGYLKDVSVEARRRSPKS